MVSDGLTRVRNTILALATLIACAEAMSLLFAGMLVPAAFLTFIIGFALMQCHWLALVWLVRGLFGGNALLTAFRAMIAAFPLLASFALVAAVARGNVASPAGSIAGIAAVPFAVTVYSLVAGAREIARRGAAGGVVHD